MTEIIDPRGNRLYLTAAERAALLIAAAKAPSELRSFCEALHFYGVPNFRSTRSLRSWQDCIQPRSRLATRYDRRADNYLSATKLVAVRIWIASLCDVPPEFGPPGWRISGG